MYKYLLILVIPILLFSSSAIEPIPDTIKYDMKKAMLGKKLFFDTILSKDKTISCATCHTLPGSGTNATPYSFGVDGAEGVVNTPTVLNSSLNFVQFWDGRADDLKEQALIPITNSFEMANTLDNLLISLKNSSYPTEFESIYADGLTIENLSDAIAEFEKALITPNARFDKYLRGDEKAINVQEKRGYQIFKKLGCISCHNGVNIGSNLYQMSGLITPYPQDKPLNGRYDITLRDRDKHMYKVPTLRNIELTAPYFHDGQVQTLNEAIKKMQIHQLGIIPNKKNTDDIEAFLKTLTGDTPAILKLSDEN